MVLLLAGDDSRRIDTLEGQPLSVSFASSDLQQHVFQRHSVAYHSIGCYLPGIHCYLCEHLF